MSPGVLLILLLVLGGVGVALVLSYSRRRKQEDNAAIHQLHGWQNDMVRIARDPATDQATLRGILAMENPHDDAFFARLNVLRALAQNPALPVELQAAAINRVSSEESAARLDKSLQAMAKSARNGGGGFVGFVSDF